MYFTPFLLKLQSSWTVDEYTPLDRGGNRGVDNLAFTFRPLEGGFRRHSSILRFCLNGRKHLGFILRGMLPPS